MTGKMWDAAASEVPAARPAIDAGLALIFDLDGVIINSMPLHTLAWRSYLESLSVSSPSVRALLGPDPSSGDFLLRMHGRRNDEIVRDFLGTDCTDQQVFEHGAAKERLFRSLMHDKLKDYLVPGIVELLQRTQGIPVALATNAERENADFMLDGAGLRHFFRVIVDGSQVKYPKPAPDVYLSAAQQLGVEPRNCIVFEDSQVGIEAARSAGMRVVGIQTQTSHLEGVAFSAPDFLSSELAHWLSSQQAVSQVNK